MQISKQSLNKFMPSVSAIIVCLATGTATNAWEDVHMPGGLIVFALGMAVATLAIQIIQHRKEGKSSQE
ncbi:MAG: hypothetical protein AAF587_29865 [Bacteroidota bacterium]